MRNDDGLTMNKSYPRVLALGIFRNRDHLLLAEGWDRVKGERFCRPLGGGVDFGERAAEALRREMKEDRWGC